MLTENTSKRLTPSLNWWLRQNDTALARGKGGKPEPHMYQISRRNETMCTNWAASTGEL